MHRPALSVGARRLRSARCRTRAGDPASRDPQRHAAAWRAVGQGPYAGRGAAGLSLLEILKILAPLKARDGRLEKTYRKREASSSPLPLWERVAAMRSIADG